MHASLVTFAFFVVSAAPSLAAPISEVQEHYLCDPMPCPPHPYNPNENPLEQIEDKRSINGIQLLPGETDPFFPDETTHSKRFACGDDIGFPCPELHLPPGVLASKRNNLPISSFGPYYLGSEMSLDRPEKRILSESDINAFNVADNNEKAKQLYDKRSIAAIKDAIAKEPVDLGPGSIVSNAKRSIPFIPKLISKMPGHISPPIGAIGGADTGLSGDVSGSDNERRSFIGTAKSILDGNLYGVGMTV